MAMQTRQEGRMEQGMALLPKMLQSIEVLQLTSVELLALIDRELEQNETLVAEESDWNVDLEAAAVPESAGDSAGDSVGDGGIDNDGSDWDRRVIGNVEDDRKQAFLENVPDRGESLVQHVHSQLAWLELSDRMVQGVNSLAERLDPRGLLTATPDELDKVLDHDLLAPCLEVLRSLEPRGIGAPDPVAAMLLQLPENDPDRLDIEAMLTRHLDALAKNRLPEVSRSLGRTVEEVRDLLTRIRSLDPHPGQGFATDRDAEAVQPDVIVRLVGDRVEVEVDEMVLPDLGIHTGYEDMVQSDATDKEVKRYLKDKIRSARDLIVAVQQRKRTLARATYAIMRRQMGFLTQGRLAVRSLNMEQIATDLDVHPSTVSRAISGKFVQTDHGVFPLRDFFDGDRRNGAPTGEAMGRMAIRHHLRDLIEGEDSRAPLSDDEIVRGLLARKIKVARRTVAKYRVEMGFASSWRRRKYEEIE
jgi:RNA polymerase sigma-54 factor